MADTSYQLSHLVYVKWALEQELRLLRNSKSNEEPIIRSFLTERIKQLKEEEKECLKTQAS